MQKTCRKQISSCILCIVLMVAMALFTFGCNGSTKKDESAAGGAQENVQTQETGVESNSQEEGEVPDGADTDVQAGASVLGEGSKVFMFTVVDQEGAQAQFEIHTDEETVGAALSQLGLIDGDESEYGLYVKTVNGMTADYDTDGRYWSFYINDEYAQTGVDATPIKEGDSYSFQMEQA